MTTEKNAEFLKYGCMSKAIMRVCSFGSVDDFCTRFEKWFCKEYYGMPQGDKVVAILRELGFEIVGSGLSLGACAKCISEGQSIIVLSRVSLNEGEPNEISHASVLESVDAQGFVLWTSSQNGWSGLLPKLPSANWSLKGCSGVGVRKAAA